jgi:hypothetical protein
VQFQQSKFDFPIMVKLGERIPSWGLSRWGGSSGLRFVPPDDEGFTLRGDRQRLVYKGRRRSHRFTILGDTAFEYDCILEREPESNVIFLRMEGAENFDFFRQADFVNEPFLKGSYNEKKKETLVGEGTGKLCHIHRPEIIDARGRRCWGDLSVVGNELRITIPEWWLSEAKYPVVIDPTIGTTTIGSQTTGVDPDNPTYDRPMLDAQMALNKYLVNQTGSGACTAYIYAYYDEADSYALPCIYTNNNDKPYFRKSLNEKGVDVNVASWQPAGWRSNTFSLNGSITAGDYIWFGVITGWFTTRFDYGGECYKFWPDWDGETLPSYLHIGPNDSFCNIKWSWYFTYGAITAQNYVCTLTQGVSLSDSHKATANYSRSAEETIQVQETSTWLHICIRKITDTAQIISSVFRGLVFSVRIITGVFVRDYILRRFLNARQELILKSCVSREITFESRIV